MGAKCCGFESIEILPVRTDIVPDVRNLQNNDIYYMVMKTSGRWPDTTWPKHWNRTLPNIMAKRELGVNKPQQFTHGDMCYINSRCIPNHSTQLDSYKSRVFCGIYSEDGNVFLSAYQDFRSSVHQHIRMYKTSDNDFELIKIIRVDGRSVMDTAFSPDGCFVAYSCWPDTVHLCNVYGNEHKDEELQFEPRQYAFGIFSLMFSSDNKEIIGGANDGYLYFYDRELNKRILQFNAHDSDVNTVKFADSSSQILYSGGDDGLCKVWDRRTLRDQAPRPVGVLSGHSDGITYIDSKGDARFFVSNSKDQTLKLWDIHHFSDQAGIEETRRAVLSQNWNYRFDQVPLPMNNINDLRGDCSVMTYRGHRIMKTLIRCKFSPEASTGQGYVYTGCATGSIVVYDILTGRVERRLEGHSLCVRDVSWHPYKNIIMSTSWDGNLLQWTYDDGSLESEDSSKKEDENKTD